MNYIKMTFLAVIPAIVLSAAPAQARCNKQCKENRKINNAIWKDRKQVTIKGENFYVGVSPDKKYALIGAASSSTDVTLNKVEKAAKTASGCSAKGDSFLLMLAGGNKDARIPMEKIKSAKRIRAELKC